MGSNAHNQLGDTAHILFDNYRTKDRLPGQGPDQDAPSEGGREKPTDSQHKPVPLPLMRYRFLSPAEWSVLARGVGAVHLDDPECQTPVTPSSSFLFPSRGMPEGLYKDIVVHRNKFFLYFHATSILRWVGMLLQLLISAVLTGIGSMNLGGVVITTMAACNTIIAGILAILHNTGLPDRYRYNQSEFEEVEDYLKMLLRSRVIEENMTVGQVLVEVFRAYHEARVTTARNDPAFYLRGQRSNDGDFPGGPGDMNGGGPAPVPRLPRPPVPTPQTKPVDKEVVTGSSKLVKPVL